jgi:hypothetical protein
MSFYFIFGDVVCRQHYFEFSLPLLAFPKWMCLILLALATLAIHSINGPLLAQNVHFTSPACF